MLIVDKRLVLWFFTYIIVVYSYHTPKQDYNKWRERFLNQKQKLVTPTTIRTDSLDSVTKNSVNNIYDNLKLRHQSRYPNLDRLMFKIDNKYNSDKKRITANSYVPLRHNRWNFQKTTTTTTDEGLFEDYGDLEYDGEDENDDNYGDLLGEEEVNDNRNNDEYVDDNSDQFLDEDIENEWQAEEPTEHSVTTSKPAPVSSLTEYKWNHYGTRSRVAESRRQQLQLQPSSEEKASRAAVEHYMKVESVVQCRRPLPKVIPVQSEHPDPSKIYTPHCTLLYRCAEDTGCCSNYATKCAPKKQVYVDLYFYAKILGTSKTSVEKLTFINHTECACLDKSKLIKPTIETQTINSMYGSNFGFGLKSASQTIPENLSKCKCPEVYTKKMHRPNSDCMCDCDNNNQDCLRMKKGKEFFRLSDRKCILENQCGTPVCEYGVYLRDIGRCQRKQEKLDSYRRLSLK